MSEIDEMRSGFETAYIDGAVASGSTYRPRFVSNNYKKGREKIECNRCYTFERII